MREKSQKEKEILEARLADTKENIAKLEREIKQTSNSRTKENKKKLLSICYENRNKLIQALT